MGEVYLAQDTKLDRKRPTLGKSQQNLGKISAKSRQNLGKRQNDGQSCNQPSLCKLLSFKGMVGSGGEARTPDLGVMNPTL
jgi:hypothetical protein